MQTTKLLIATILIFFHHANLPTAAASELERYPARLVPITLLEKKLVMLGEIHGTQQSPLVLLSVVEAAVEHGHRVLVGLELIYDKISDEEDFVENPKQNRQLADVLHGSFWRDEYQDGRASLAMSELLVGLRVLNKKRADSVQVVILDDRVAYSGAIGSRDKFMADRLRTAIDKGNADFIVTLTGNLHNKQSREGTSSMADFLRDLKPMSLGVRFGGGDAWICQSATADGCGVTSLQSKADKADHAELWLNDGLDAKGYHGYLYFPRLTASPPAARAYPSRSK
jgi:hypothetical protein